MQDDGLDLQQCQMDLEAVDVVWRPDLTVLLLEGVAEKKEYSYFDSCILRQQPTIYISLLICVSTMLQLSTVKP
jgi:hypothetical protein